MHWNLLIGKDGTIVGIDWITGCPMAQPAVSCRDIARFHHPRLPKSGTRTRPAMCPNAIASKISRKRYGALGHLDLDASEISMSRLLTQLFDVTDRLIWLPNPSFCCKKPWSRSKAWPAVLTPRSIFGTLPSLLCRVDKKIIRPEAVIREIAEAARLSRRPLAPAGPWRN